MARKTQVWSIFVSSYFPPLPCGASFQASAARSFSALLFVLISRSHHHHGSGW
ncbi:uncharacterized protein THITE_2170661 [Thermothielavioides terrestris NRRL 8126]|uniref:Uncharacterized protein n=1 Tax=Thermothielavioides terrestris (strain ATCC 38088 / NRRL 8126) TaxID=578455 RepID=G2R7W0_THETT|nr:uncharacterized protein THITE_2170661 [Thermothielavioides terrestris NRRL 8126]AEO68019.1 hypothetical protein THITE_2170661 [Thermothielavioides terrestris NRRL 8126]